MGQFFKKLRYEGKQANEDSCRWEKCWYLIGLNSIPGSAFQTASCSPLTKAAPENPRRLSYDYPTGACQGLCTASLSVTDSFSISGSASS